MALREPMPLEEERAVFLHELGEALAHWTSLENHLGMLAGCCYPPGVPQQSFRVGFFKIQGFHSKLLMAQHSVERTLVVARPELTDPWIELAADLLKASYKRNNLAHYKVRVFHGEPVGQRIASSVWVYPKNTPEGRRPDDSLALLQVVSARMEFQALVVRLQNFQARATAQPLPHPVSGEQPAGLPTIRQIRLQIHAALGHQHPTCRETRRAQEALNEAASLSGQPEAEIQNGQIESEKKE